MRKLGLILGSVALPLALSFALFIFCAIPAYAASSLFLNSSAKEVRAGDRIIVDVRINATDQSINAVSGVIIFPETLLRVLSVTKEQSIISLWTREPVVGKGRVPFEGIVLNPGFQGSNGQIFKIVFEAKRTGTANISFIEGAVLANDGLGTNIVTSLSPTVISISDSAYSGTVAEVFPTNKVLALPVITEYSAMVGPEGAAYLKGRGEPGALTKIVFKDTSFRSIGEQFIASLQPSKKTLDDVFVRNNAEDGSFEYYSPNNLAAGAYNTTPFLVDPNTQAEKPGLGVQFLVNDSRLVRVLVVLVNVLALLIPIVGLAVLIYFIPWYSFRRMRVIRRRLGLEEDRIELSKHELRREDTVRENTTQKLISPQERPNPVV